MSGFHFLLMFIRSMYPGNLKGGSHIVRICENVFRYWKG